MRQAAKIVAAVAIIASVSGTSVSEAAFFSYPRMLNLQLDPQPQIDRIGFGAPVLAPMAHVRFCLSHKSDCEVHRDGGQDIALTLARWNELNTINRQVNRDIIPREYFGNVAFDQWHISPRAGDCADYAVTKRHELLALGWPSQALLLAEVVVPSGEHHLVLVVRTNDADLVLDNLNENIRTVAMTRLQYRWVRVESPDNPMFWASVTVPAPARKPAPPALIQDVMLVQTATLFA